MSSPKQIILLYGGASSEHEISVRSAKTVASWLTESKYAVELIAVDKNGHARIQCPAAFQQTTSISDTQKDQRINLEAFFEDAAKAGKVLFPLIHGSTCESGELIAISKLAGLKTVGCSFAAHTLCFDKDVCKRVAASIDIDVVPWQLFQSSTLSEDFCKQTIEKLGSKLFLKPSREGSAIGTALLANATPETLYASIKETIKFDSKVLVEKALDMSELEVAFLGTTQSFQISGVGEVSNQPGEFYTYENKYADTSTSQLFIPARITTEQAEHIRQQATKLAQILELNGLARIDFFMEKSTDHIYFNEINTLPGFTSISQYPQLFAHEGISGTELVEKLIAFAK